MPETSAEKDVFKRANAWQIWQYLLIEPAKNGHALAKAKGLCVSSTYDALKWLQGCGLVIYSPSEGLYYSESATNSTLELLSVNLGTSGMTERRKAGYVREREIRANRQMARARRLRTLYGL